jgi:DNA-binding transcriptional ArsR family regulator
MNAPLLRRLIAERQRRERYFDISLFGEPSWDAMLDLALAAAEGRRISVTSACIGAGAPLTTALRHLSVLGEHGLVERQPDPEDARRCFVALTEAGRDAMGDYLASFTSPAVRAA